MKNAARVGWALAAALLLAGCTDDAQRAAPRSTTTATDGTPSGRIVDAGDLTIEPGPQAPDLVAGAWTDLPASPVGPWTSVSRFPLWDGSGWVEWGSFLIEGGKPTDLSRRIAYFSLDDRRYLELPPLPVHAGLGPQPSGVRVGDRLVLVGYDCPATTSTSFQGAEYCAPEGGASAKVVLVDDLAGKRWQRLAVPEWMKDYELGSPRVLGTRDGKVLLASAAKSLAIAELDPATGAWERLDQGMPEAEPNGWFACMIDREVVILGTTSSWRGSIAVGGVSGFRRDGDDWVALRLPTGDVSVPTCGRRGIYVWRITGENAIDGTLLFVDPATGKEQVVTDVPAPTMSYSVSGDVMLLPAPWTSDPAEQQIRPVATPYGRVDLPTGLFGWGFLVGDVIVDGESARVFTMGVNADG